MFRRILSAVLVVLLLLSVLPCSALATESDPEFRFELYVTGRPESRAEPGDVVTVSLYVHRTDSDESYNMYGMQTEISYDTQFFRLVGDSSILTPGIVAQNVQGVGRYDEMYMNFLSLTGNDKWEAKRFVGSFQLEVIAETGVSRITLEDTLVSHPDGIGTYKVQNEDHTVIVSTDCTIVFDTNGGSKVQDQIVVYGEKLVKPEDPVREGYVFAGWYKDIHLQEAWDFDTDVVKESTALYAKWIIGESTATEPTEGTVATNPTNPTDGFFNDPEDSPMIWVLLLVVLVAALGIILLLIFRRKKGKPEEESSNETPAP